MKIKIWGARGSLPAPPTPEMTEKHFKDLMHHFFDAGFYSREDVEVYLGSLSRAQYGGFGGNTPCIEVSHNTDQLIIDGGSGIRLLGYSLLGGPCGKGHGVVHIYMTHFHWDHLIGLPFFVPIFIPGNEIHFHAVQEDLEQVIRTVFKKPFFPVPFEGLASKIFFHKLEPRKEFQLGQLKMTPYLLDHPDPCWGVKVEAGGKIFSHCVDTEGTRISKEELGEDLPLYQGVDLMLFDAQYSLMETIEKVNWGHAAASLGLDIAMREGIKKVLFMHHDPASTGDKISAAESQARKYYDSQIKGAKRSGTKIFEVDWGYAYEGLTIEL